MAGRRILLAKGGAELTVHPGALPTINDYLVQAAKRSQVVITTHSPEMLDLVDGDSVRVVERRDGATSVAPMAEDQKDAGCLILGAQWTAGCCSEARRSVVARAGDAGRGQ